MAESKKTAKAGPIADVAHPDKSVPADNSRSLVINRPILQDPMMTTGAEKVPKSADKPSVTNKKASRAVTIQPLSGSVEPSSKTEPKAPPVPSPSGETETGETPKLSESKADESSPAAEANAKLVDEEAERAKQAEHEAAIQKTIDSKKYFLPIKTVEQRKSARFVALGVLLALLLIVAWADIALDAGLIQINGVKPVTHFFSN